MAWIDAHAHWAQAFPAGSDTPGLDSRIQQLREQGMVHSIQAGVDPEDWNRQLELAQKYPDWISPVLGLHPWWVKDHSFEQCDQALGELEKLLVQNKDRVVAVGELGIDFSKNGRESEALQLRIFDKQIELAQRFEKPLVLHLVHAHESALKILKSHSQSSGLRGIVHAFTGSVETAREYLALGLKLSIGPGICEPGRFLKLKKALPLLEPGDWVLESDWAGEHFFKVVQAASGLTHRPVGEIARQCRENLGKAGLIRG